MNVIVGPGSITQMGPIDLLAYGSIAADATDQMVKMGINITPTTFSLTAPSSVGQSINYLIEAAFEEVDGSPIVLPYYNASNPAQSFSGPGNSGTPQIRKGPKRTATTQIRNFGQHRKSDYSSRRQWLGGSIPNRRVLGSDAGDGRQYRYHSYGTIFDLEVARAATRLWFGRPEFRNDRGIYGSRGVTQVEVEIWGAGSGTYASVPTVPSGGGSGGGYAKRLVTGLTPGQTIPVTVGAGGVAGTTGGVAAGPGGTSTFGLFMSATGGSLNSLATTFAPENGATPPGAGVGGDVNFTGSAGQAGVYNQGGMGGASPIGGAQNSGASGTRYFSRWRRFWCWNWCHRQLGVQRRRRRRRISRRKVVVITKSAD